MLYSYIMKKITFILGIIITLISCSEKKEQIKPHTKLENFILEFCNKNPNTFNNNITEVKSWDIFRKEITEFYKSYDSSFYFHPVSFKEFIEIDKITYGLFSFINEKIEEKNVKDYEGKSMHVDLLVKVPKSQMDTLIEGKKYQIIGKFERYKPRFSNPDEPWEPYLSKIISSKEFHLGSIVLNPTYIKRIEWRERMILKGKINE
jgi:hypothetical protein